MSVIFNYGMSGEYDIEVCELVLYQFALGRSYEFDVAIGGSRKHCIAIRVGFVTLCSFLEVLVDLLLLWELH